MLAILNFIICSLGAGLCLLSLITKHADTRHWQRLFFISFAGLSFTIWLVSGMVNHAAVRLENVAARGLIAIGMVFSVYGMIQRDIDIKKLKCKNCGKNPYEGV